MMPFSAEPIRVPLLLLFGIFLSLTGADLDPGDLSNQTSKAMLWALSPELAQIEFELDPSVFWNYEKIPE